MQDAALPSSRASEAAAISGTGPRGAQATWKKTCAAHRGPDLEGASTQICTHIGILEVPNTIPRHPKYPKQWALYPKTKVKQTSMLGTLEVQLPP